MSSRHCCRVVSTRIRSGTAEQVRASLSAYNVADILILMRIITNQVAPSQQQQEAADVAPLFNNVPAPDGEINLGDLVAIQRKVLGLVNFDFIN